MVIRAETAVHGRDTVEGGEEDTKMLMVMEGLEGLEVPIDQLPMIDPRVDMGLAARVDMVGIELHLTRDMTTEEDMEEDTTITMQGDMKVDMGMKTEVSNVFSTINHFIRKGARVTI